MPNDTPDKAERGSVERLREAILDERDWWMDGLDGKQESGQETDAALAAVEREMRAALDSMIEMEAELATLRKERDELAAWKRDILRLRYMLSEQHRMLGEP